MSPDLVIVQVVEFLACGDAVHRFHAPARALSRIPGVTVVDCDVLHRCLPALAREADVLVMAALNADLFPLIESRRRAVGGGRITVLEANDYYPDLQAWNPLSMRWLDRSLQDSFHHAMRLVDGVQTSVPALEERWRRITDRPIAAFANHLETVGPLPPPRSGPLTVGWGGSPGHFADWCAVAPVLEHWLEQRPDVRLAVMTNAFARDFVRIDPSRLLFRDFGSLDAWIDFVGEIDIGLAPLLPTEYNRCRSDVKLLEYAARGVAGIYRDLEPYRGSVVHGETGLLYQTDDDLRACLDRLADDVALRRRIGANAHAWLARERQLDARIHERLDFYRSLGAIAHGSMPQAVLTQGMRAGRYVRFEQEGAGGERRRALDAAPSAEIARALEEITQAHPDDLLAWQRLAELNNTLREPKAALVAIERALALDPERSRTWVEAGRARWLLDDAHGAREALERAVACNPRYAPAWFALLSLLGQMGEGCSAERFAAARAHLPFNYGLGLQAVRLLAPQARVDALRGLLDESTFAQEEAPRAGAAFSAAIAALTAEQRAHADGRALLARACARFPASVRLARLRAQAEMAAGDAGLARHEHDRARTLESAARLNAAAGLGVDRVSLWQIAEHVRAHTGPD